VYVHSRIVADSLWRELDDELLAPETKTTSFLIRFLCCDGVALRSLVQIVSLVLLTTLAGEQVRLLCLTPVGRLPERSRSSTDQGA
jgi:hypothetical protein